ncbi:invasin domain 3-containing protein [Conexibacter woesei]|uniref:Ig domain protein group 1 domain protein n=1 Tax=Conexibacter woesei (strain DSM 14684 / CCUG 47730 / CIP 108061 / JCM 11494 / NBRC 100937 / ID131577) TaxID=469383 RepID=D3F882_CONWI|nr:invasin domain 3-containing protein [Conexibacter woesei]ADB48952.1 Ig domain protein group 1 domain protein [Conexibacter woesei DSM 14684]
MPPRSLRLCAVLVSIACLALATASSAGAVTMSRSFSPTASARTFDVPAGVTSLDVVAVGAKGGSGGGGAAGGFGARVGGTLAVAPGDRLWIAVGGNGPSAGCPESGGWNGGANGGSNWCAYRGGSGGGASDVRVCEPGAACVADDPLGRLLVAGGGGGGGGGAHFVNDQSAAGGAAGSPGATAVLTNRGTAGGGGAGTDSAGGGAGTTGDTGGSWTPWFAEPGALAVGGTGGTGQGGGLQGGGGGGGGRYGGGGGGSANYYAGGGGGGSNLVPAGGIASTDATGSPKVTLSWEVGAPATVDRPALAAPAVYADGGSTTTVTTVVRDAAGAPVTGGEVTFSSTAPQPQIGATSDNGDGTYSATVTAAGTRGTTTITAHLAVPDQTSAGVTLDQVDHPRVTSPGDGTTAIDAPDGRAATVTVSGTADALTASVFVGCVTRSSFRRLGGSAAEAVPVADGAWTVADATLPAIWTATSQCRLAAVPAGFSEARENVGALPGPRVRRLRVSSDDAGGGATWYSATAGGLAGEAAVRALGSDCGVTLRTVDEQFRLSSRWLSCGAELAWGSSIGSEPNLVVDGRPAFTAGLASATVGAVDGAPRVTVERSVAADGSFVVTERGATARCTGTDAMPATVAECGPLAGTGVTAVVRTQVSPSGRHVTRALLFESSDARPHEVRVVLATRTGSYATREYRFGDESAWTQRAADETISAASGRYSVLTRDGADLSRPAVAVTATPAPSEQLLAGGRLMQRYVRTVPADGTVAGLGMTLDLADGTAIEAAAAAARDAYDVGVEIDGPLDGATTDAETATLTGSAFDGAGPVALRVGGEPVTVGDDGRWSAEFPLRAGANTIEAVVASPFGPREERSVTVTYVPPPEPPEPEPPTPTTPTTPTTPSTPTTPVAPPIGQSPATKPPAAAPTPRLVERLVAPARVRLTRARERGVAIPLTLGADRSRVAVELRGPSGVFAHVRRTHARRGPVVLRLKPSRRAVATAARALTRRKAVALRLTLTVRLPSGESQTVARTIRLVR